MTTLFSLADLEGEQGASALLLFEIVFFNK